MSDERRDVDVGPLDDDDRDQLEMEKTWERQDARRQVEWERSQQQPRWQQS